MSRYKQPYSLYKRGSYWYYRTYTPDGVRTSGISTGCKLKSDAKHFCEKLYLTGSLFSSNKMFNDYAIHFYDDNSSYIKDRVEPLAENTLRGYRIKLQQAILPFFENVKLSEINYTKLKAFRIYIMQRYATASVVGTMSCLKHIIDYAFRDRLISVNPFEYLEPMNAKLNIRDAFSFDEVKTLYQKIPAEFKKTILLMALTGMRISEAVGVSDNDIKLTDKCQYIDLKNQYNLKKIKPVKQGSERQIPIISEIKELFGFNHSRLPAFYKAYNEVKKQFNDFEKRGLSFHSLRHFMITNSKAFGIAEVKIEYLVGHKLGKIQSVYTNFKADDVIEIIEWQKITLSKLLQ